MARELHDHYFHQAKRDGYLSRAAYKLIEIDKKKSILHKGAYVLDCGSAPGSWIQVAANRVESRGFVVGIDKQPVTATFKGSNTHIMLGDLTETPAEDFLQHLPPTPSSRKKGASPKFDAIISDMAPFTTGDHSTDHHKSVRLCQAVLDRCGDLLFEGGNLVMKVFEGEVYPELLQQTREMFRNVKGFKPKASRGESTEMYITATGYKGAVQPGAHPGAHPGAGKKHRAEGLEEDLDDQGPSPEIELPKRKPSTGWG